MNTGAISPDTNLFIDGERVDLHVAHLSAFDRGFLYGDTVFETMRTYGRSLFRSREHLERLAESARLMHFQLPWSTDFLAREVHALVSEIPAENQYVRLTVTRGVSDLGLHPRSAQSPRRILQVSPLSLRTSVPRSGQAITHPSCRPFAGLPEGAAKCGNYAYGVIMAQLALERSADEVLMVRPSGLIVEGATSSLFWVEQGQVMAPPLSSGILPGITRASLIELLSETGRSTQLVEPNLQRLLLADELFVASTLKEVLPIVAIDGQLIHKGEPGPLALELLSEFRALAGVPSDSKGWRQGSTSPSVG